MLAEIFMLRVETATREAAKDAARFVPITLPTAPAKPTNTDSVAIHPATVRESSVPPRVIRSAPASGARRSHSR